MPYNRGTDIDTSEDPKGNTGNIGNGHNSHVGKNTSKSNRNTVTEDHKGNTGNIRNAPDFSMAGHDNGEDHKGNTGHINSPNPDDNDGHGLAVRQAVQDYLKDHMKRPASEHFDHRDARDNMPDMGGPNNELAKELFAKVIEFINAVKVELIKKLGPEIGKLAIKALEAEYASISAIIEAVIAFNNGATSTRAVLIGVASLVSSLAGIIIGGVILGPFVGAALNELLKELIEKLGDHYGYPLILDLDGDGIELVAAKDSTAYFDYNNDGKAEHTGWVGKDDGILVYDWQGDGRITDANEIVLTSWNPGAKSDLEGLAGLDANKDGKITLADAAYGKLKIWRDANQNGLVDANEMYALSAYGITFLGLTGDGKSTVQEGNIIVQQAQYGTQDGALHSLGDVGFGFELREYERALVQNGTPSSLPRRAEEEVQAHQLHRINRGR